MFSVENVPPVNVEVKILKMQHQLYFRGWVFLGVVETVVGWPVYGGVGIVFSIFCITSFGDCSRPQNQETTNLGPVYMEVGNPRYLLCKRDQTKMRDCMDRWVTPKTRFT